jgi:energy-coupling factor transporter transmembrane protein EcfT
VPVDKVVERTVVKKEKPGLRDYVIIIFACLITGFSVGRFLKS